MRKVNTGRNNEWGVMAAGLKPCGTETVPVNASIIATFGSESLSNQHCIWERRKVGGKGGGGG